MVFWNDFIKQYMYDNYTLFDLVD